jgi:hypothetical protein
MRLQDKQPLTSATTLKKEFRSQELQNRGQHGPLLSNDFPGIVLELELVPVGYRPKLR